MYALLAFAVLNVALLVLLLWIARPRPDSMPGLGGALGSRFDGIDRNAEALRRELTQMDQGLRAAIGEGIRGGLTTAFDKVQEAAKAQAEQLRDFGREHATKLGDMQEAISQFGNNVGVALGDLRRDMAEAETRAADGRSLLVRDTTDAIGRAREAIDASLRTFGDHQRERLQHAETAVRESREAAEAASARTEKALADQREAITAQLSQGAAGLADRLGKELGGLAEHIRAGFDAFSTSLREQQEQLRNRVEQKLDEIRTGNESKLEQMRKAVDEQLQSALEKRLNESFKAVTEQFAQVQQAIGQVQNVTGQIGDLKRLFSNVKARGGWGEAHIQALLDDVLPPGAYETNLRIGHEAGQVVEFALRMPLRRSGGDIWLAIDAKFPTEDYDRLLLAAEAGDREQEIAARKALERRIREEAKRISGKYINPPGTVEYAVMYLPSEGLYAEVYRIPGLIEALRRQYAVMVMGPSVLPGLLHCIRVGHLTLALEQKAGAIGEILSAVKSEWSNLGKSLDVLARRAQTLSNGIRDAQKHNRGVGRALEQVDALDGDRAQRVLGLSGEAIVIDADGEDIAAAEPGAADDDMPEPRAAAE
jgi:DNA recombination protein RmuC